MKSWCEWTVQHCTIFFVLAVSSLQCRTVMKAKWPKDGNSSIRKPSRVWFEFSWLHKLTSQQEINQQTFINLKWSSSERLESSRGWWSVLGTGPFLRRTVIYWLLKNADLCNRQMNSRACMCCCVVRQYGKTVQPSFLLMLLKLEEHVSFAWDERFIAVQGPVVHKHKGRVSTDIKWKNANRQKRIPITDFLSIVCILLVHVRQTQ